jgi:mycoredoxin
MPTRNAVDCGVVDPAMTHPITMYGADWCSDCRRSKKLLDGMGVDYEYIDVEAIESAADAARAISGRTNIPVVTFPDGTHFVEPSDAELRAKVEALQST